jgi:hypothetical protein
MRNAVLILPGRDGRLPTGDDFRRAGFAVSTAVAPGAPLPAGPPGQCAASCAAKERGEAAPNGAARMDESGLPTRQRATNSRPEASRTERGRSADEQLRPESGARGGKSEGRAPLVPDDERAKDMCSPCGGKDAYSTSA